MMSVVFTMTLVSRTYETCGEGIADMPIADGLKEALVNSGLTRKQILTYGTDELASMLEIEQYVANLILEAAKQLD